MTSISTTEPYTSRSGPLYPQEYPNIDSIMDSYYRKKIEANVFKQLWVTPQPKSLRGIISDAYDEVVGTEQENEVSAVDEVMKERKEARARDVLYKLDGILNEGVDLVVFEVTFNVGGKAYEYAARLAGDGCWYVTGKDTAGRKPEEFKGFIAEKALEAHEVVFEGEVL